MIDYNKLLTKWSDILMKVEENDGSVHPLEIEKPATMEEVNLIEQRLGYKLPESFREIVLKFSKSLNFMWFFSDETVVPEEFKEIYCGELSWNIDHLEDCTENAKEMEADGYGQGLKGKLEFHSSSNGDIYAFDMEAPTDDKPIVYWDHDEDEVIYIADSFMDYLEKITELDCIGSEIWQLEYFLTDNGLTTASNKAIRWKKWFSNFTQIKLSDVKDHLENLIEYVTHHGKITDEIRKAFSSFEYSDVFEKTLLRLDETEEYYKKQPLFTIVGEVLGSCSSEWVRDLWENEKVEETVRSYLTAKCLPDKEGLDRVFQFLEKKFPDKMSGYEAKNHLSYFKSNEVIHWMIYKVNLPVTEGWSELFSVSNPTWTDVVTWINLDMKHQLTVINALERKTNYDEGEKIQEVPSKEEVIKTLLDFKEKQILETKKKIIDHIIENIYKII